MIKANQDTLIPHNREATTSASSSGENQLNFISKWVEKKDWEKETTVVDSTTSNNEGPLNTLSQQFTDKI